MEYDPDPRRAWCQWDAADRRWLEALCDWTRRYQQLLRQQFARRLLVDTLEEFMAATAAEAPERQALRAQRPPRPEYPEHCRDLRCGATTRARTPDNSATSVPSASSGHGARPARSGMYTSPASSRTRNVSSSRTASRS